MSKCAQNQLDHIIQLFQQSIKRGITEYDTLNNLAFDEDLLMLKILAVLRTVALFSTIYCANSTARFSI